MKYAFAGDRQISCNILNFMISKGFYPEILLVTDDKTSTHSSQLIEISTLPQQKILVGKDILKSRDTLNFLKELKLDYIIGIHYPYIIPQDILKTPKIGFLNLHPAYLPFNKGWNTPSWTILENTTYGATLHFMSEALDEGDIIHQKTLDTYSYDTANSLYQRVLKLEEEVFIEAFNNLITCDPPRIQQSHKGTSHKKTDLLKIREIKLNELVKVKDLLNKLRALTTNNNQELAFYIEEEKKIGVKIEFVHLEE